MSTPDGEIELYKAITLFGESSEAVSFDDPFASKWNYVDKARGTLRPRRAGRRSPVGYETYRHLKINAESLKPELAEGRKATFVEHTTGSGFGPTSERGLDEDVEENDAAPEERGELSARSPRLISEFEAIPYTRHHPPDCTMAAGPRHLMLAVNSTVAVYDKAGNALRYQFLDAWFHDVRSDVRIFDPRLIYDQLEGRWILAAVARPDDDSEGSWFLFSVSKNSDPLAGWYFYSLDAALDNDEETANWADFPCLGIDEQAIYLTSNMYNYDPDPDKSYFQYVKLRIIPKREAYNGSAIHFKDIVGLKNADGSLIYTLQPCHTYGSPRVEHLINSLYPTRDEELRNQLTLWSLTDPFSNLQLRRKTVTVDPFGFPPYADQKNGVSRLDTGDVGLVSAVFRGGSVWTALSTQYNWGGGSNVAAAHWFQINATSGTVLQQGVYGAANLHYFYTEVMPDTRGNMMILFCRSGQSEFASLHFAGRRATDPPGHLQPGGLLKAGTDSYDRPDSNNISRWGDYAGIAIDPENGRRIWLYGQHTSRKDEWGTSVGSAQI